MRGISKEIWLLLAQEGRMGFADIRRAVSGTPREAERALYAMCNAGTARKFETTPPKYGITPDCIVPRCTTVAEMLAALGEKR